MLPKFNQITDYELFAYIASGFSALAVFDLAGSSEIILGADWNASSGIVTLLFSYILGQIIAAPSKAIVEQWIVAKLFLAPSIVLMGRSPKLRKRIFLKKTLFREYYTPLVDHMRTRIDRSETSDAAQGEALFWRAFAVAKQDSIAYLRMQIFLKLYGFCRNMAFIGLSGSLVIFVSILLEHGGLGSELLSDERIKWVFLTQIIGIGMFHRYLKFYRLYCLETFQAYASSIQIEDP